LRNRWCISVHDVFNLCKQLFIFHLFPHAHKMHLFVAI
jgi:hypothetical protein